MEVFQLACVGADVGLLKSKALLVQFLNDLKGALLQNCFVMADGAIGPDVLARWLPSICR